MSATDLQQASLRRQGEMLDEIIDGRINLLLANYQAVTANPRSMGYLRSLLKHYAKSPTPFRACVAENTKRFGPGRVEKVCAVVKDAIRQSTDWRGHPERDHGSPGVAIAEADAPFASVNHASLADALVAEHGSADVPEEVWGVLEHLSENCNPFRVIVGLDEPSSAEGFVG